MKKTTLLLLIVFISFKSLGQNYSLNLFMGFDPAKTGAGTLDFYYVDESPSQDNLSSRVEMPEKKMGFVIGGNFDYKTESNVLLRFGIKGLVGKVSGFEVDFGGGYEAFNNEKFNISPMLILTYGSAGVKLGDIYQNDVYIEVNHTQFYSESVAVRLKRKHFLATPKIAFGIPISDNMEIFSEIGYQLPLSISSSYLEFQGEDENNETKTAKESINANNVYLALNNKQIKSNYIGVNGLSINFGLKIKL